MFDFPNSPVTGTTATTPNSAVFTWDGVKWISGTMPSSTVHVQISDTAPIGPNVGDMWFDSAGTQTYLRYNDGTSTQWVPAVNQQSGIPEAPTDGGYYTRRNTGWANLTAAPQSQAAYTNVGRNFVQNPYFNIAQRGAGPFTANGYTLDRWTHFFTLDTCSISQVAFGLATLAADEAAEFALATTFTGNAGAGAYTTVWQSIEDVRRLSNKTVTVSFYANTGSGTLKLGVSLAQKFGTGGSPSADVIINGQSVTVGGGYTRQSLTFTLPSIAGKTLGSNNDSCTNLYFWYSSGATNNTFAGGIGVQSGTVYLWGVQLEVGSGATPLEHIDPGLDLRHCQRFFYSGVPPLRGTCSGTTAMSRLAARHPVKMRAVPTLTLVSPLPVFDGNTTSTLTVIGTGSTECTVDVLEFDGTSATPMTGVGYPILVYQGAGGNLQVSADL